MKMKEVKNNCHNCNTIIFEQYLQCRYCGTLRNDLHKNPDTRYKLYKAMSSNKIVRLVK